MYTVGTSVLYSRIGVCEVEEIGPPPSPKMDDRNYYKLRSVFSSSSGLVIYAPVDTTVFMRPLIDGSKAIDYLEQLPSLETQAVHSGNPAEQAARYQELLDTCQVLDSLVLLKELDGRRRELAGRKKKLGQLEERYLKTAEKLVCEEFAAVLRTTPEQIKEQLYAAMAPRKQASA